MNELNHYETITRPEIESLIDAVVVGVEYDPKTIIGLMFLFGSIKKLVDAGRANHIYDAVLFPALLKLHSMSPDVDEAINRKLENISAEYREND